MMSDTEKKRPFRWWDRESVAQLVAQVNASPDGAIVKQYEDDPGHLHVHPYHPASTVLVEGDDCPPPINNVHICPIDCP